MMDYDDDDADKMEMENADELPEDDISDEELNVTDDSFLRLEGHQKDVFCLAMSPQSSKLLSGAEDDKAIAWNVASLNDPRLFGITLPELLNLESIEKVVIDLHKDSVLMVNFNYDGTLFATADMLGKIFIHDTATNTMLYEIDYCDDIEWTLWHHSVNILFAGTSSGAVYMFLLSRNKLEQSKVYVSETNSPCTAGKLLTDGKRLFCTYRDGTVLLWTLKEATYVCASVNSSCTVIDLHPEIPLAAVGTENGFTVLINTVNLNIVSRLNGNDTPKTESTQTSVEAVKFAPNNYPWLAVGTSDGILSIYDFNSHQLRYECSHDEIAIVKTEWLLLPDNKLRVLTACYDGGLRGWDARTGEPVFFKHGGHQIFDLLPANIAENVVLFTACANGVIQAFKYEEDLQLEDSNFEASSDAC